MSRQQKEKTGTLIVVRLIAALNSQSAGCELIALVELVHHFEKKRTQQIDCPGIPSRENALRARKAAESMASLVAGRAKPGYAAREGSGHIALISAGKA